MALESEVSKIFYDHVFCPKDRHKSFRVLVLDERSTSILSACLRMQDIMATGITLVENIMKKRRALPMEAIYILEPSHDSVIRLLRDFSSFPRNYPAAYVYFTVACSDDILKHIANSGCVKYFKALSVLNIGFKPIESHICSVDCHDTAWLYTCNVDYVPDMNNRLESLAEQIATLCVTLNEFPKIRYRKRARNAELAQFIQLKLAKHKEDNPQLGQGPHKDRSILLLLDRGFDPITPLLHDLTLQSLIRDLKEIDDNTFKYGNSQEYVLSDKDKLWKELRNDHIADVSRLLPQRLRAFAESKQHFLASRRKAKELASGTPSLGGSQESLDSTGTLGSGGVVNLGAEVPAVAVDALSRSSTGSSNGSAASIRALQNMVHEMPQYQKEAASYNALVAMTDFCLSACRENINHICTVEQATLNSVMDMLHQAGYTTLFFDTIFIVPTTQDLAMGQTAQGDTVANPMMALVNILKPDSMTEVDRFRLILIYILTQGGILESNLEKLLDYARLSLTYKSLVAAMSSVFGARLISSVDGTFDSPLFRGLPNISDAPPFVQYYLPVKGKRLHDVDENSYAVSRWVPYLDDILEKCISDTLDSQFFPYLAGPPAHTSAFLQTPQVGASAAPGDLRGPSARFRAASPATPGIGGGGADPGGATSGLGARGFVGGGGVGGSGVPQRSGSGRSDRLSDEFKDGEARLSDHCGPRLIVFVIGGATWPETRVCYSVTQRCIEARLVASEKSSTLAPSTLTKSRGRLGGKHGRNSGGNQSEQLHQSQHTIKNGGGTGWNWEVVLGGTGILTPKQFVMNLKNLVEH